MNAAYSACRHTLWVETAFYHLIVVAEVFHITTQRIYCVLFLGHTPDNAFPHSLSHTHTRKKKYNCPGFVEYEKSLEIKRELILNECEM